MKHYTMIYKGDNKVAAALDDLLAYLHNSQLFGQKVNLKSYTVNKALVILKDFEVTENEAK